MYHFCVCLWWAAVVFCRPEEIQQLYEMGFHAEPQTLEDLLHAVQGNLDKAIDLL